MSLIHQICSNLTSNNSIKTLMEDFKSRFQPTKIKYHLQRLLSNKVFGKPSDISTIHSFQLLCLSTILVIIFWQFIVSQRVGFATSKTVHVNFAYEIAYESPNNLGVKILENQGVLGKCQIWAEAQPRAQSPIQKLKLALALALIGLNLHKSIYKIFLALVV